MKIDDVAVNTCQASIGLIGRRSGHGTIIADDSLVVAPPPSAEQRRQ
jgi:hypothetical protein